MSGPLAVIARQFLPRLGVRAWDLISRRSGEDVAVHRELELLEVLPRGERIQFREAFDLRAVLQKQTAVVHSVCFEETQMHPAIRLATQPEQEVGVEAAQLEEADTRLSLVAEQENLDALEWRRVALGIPETPQAFEQFALVLAEARRTHGEICHGVGFVLRIAEERAVKVPLDVQARKWFLPLGLLKLSSSLLHQVFQFLEQLVRGRPHAIRHWLLGDDQLAGRDFIAFPAALLPRCETVEIGLASARRGIV